MSRRLQITLPDPIATQLAELAAAAGEPPASLAARLIADGVARGATRSDATRPRLPVRSTERPSWLEPYGGDRAWRRETWTAIVALHDRYPRHLEHLKDGWWNDEATTETLAALAAWRIEIDQHGRDPREEIAFHHQLARYAQTLHKLGGGVESRWQPGPPPQSWIDA
jgi:hypothetical protein